MSVRRSVALKRFRSTKGASKARRDQINAEIRALRDLLPIGPEQREKLSYLQSMGLTCSFIRKTELLREEADSAGASPLTHSFLQALPGFLVALTAEGKLIYVSENVTEYLGLSMVEVLQGESFWDMMDSQDADALKLMLRDPDLSTERSLVCRMLASKSVRLQSGSGCSMLITGRFRSECVFVALCTPTADRLQDRLHGSGSFHTLHRPDMSLTHAPYSVLFHLGFSAEELIGRSWYGLLHPDDLTLAAHCHNTLLGAEGGSSSQMLVRLQRKDLSWIRLYVCATLEASRESITCVNHILSETEAEYLREKLYGGAPVPQASVRRKTRSVSDSGFSSSPPYSPASSLSSDLQSEGYRALEQLVCGSHFCPSDIFAGSHHTYPDALPHPYPDALPHSYPDALHHPYPDALPPVCPPDARLVPISRPECVSVLHPEDFMFSQDSMSDLLTPEPSVDGRFLFEPPEIGTLAHQIRSLACSFNAYSSAGLCWPLLDEAVIDSILQDLDTATVKHTAWSPAPLRPPSGPTPAPLRPLCGPPAAPLRPLSGPPLDLLRPPSIPPVEPTHPLHHGLYATFH
ncbi:neuronal PAS domain-containing protein 4-like isoform X2 [Pseudorasbora parva]|uniref:neuronal PAS domain-containing protein 4-like isoform X2 n=2 Tax=Pseudorasbora parva TaxID=51549 RepID=UPI00351F54CB